MDLIFIVTLASASGRGGGPVTAALEQLRAAKSHGYEARLLAGALRGDVPDGPQYDGAEFAVVRPLSSRLPYSTAISAGLLRLQWRRIGQTRAVHVAFARDLIAISACIFALARRKVLIVQPHGMITVASNGALHRLIDRFLMRPLARRATSAVFLTQSESDEFEAWLGRTVRGVIAGNGVDLAALPPRAPRREEVLFLARLDQRKRPELFAAAALYARKHGLSGSYVLVGPDGGNLHLALDCCADVPGCMRYEGPVEPSSVVERLRHASVFVLTTLREQWGIVLVQAISLGIPVVVDTTAAMAEEVRREGLGLVVDSLDDAGLAVAVDRLLTDDSLYATCSEKCLRYGKSRLAAEVVQQPLLGLYNRAVRQVAAPR